MTRPVANQLTRLRQKTLLHKLDLIFGPDANALATDSAGLLSANSDLGIKQAYVSLRAPAGNGLEFKLVFGTPL